MAKRITCVVAVVAMLGAVLVAAPASAAPGATGHAQIPSEVPSSISPAVNDGRVQAITQVGNTMVIGGTFTSVTPTGGTATSRTKVVAFDATTGALRDFNPVLNGDVEDLLEGPVPGTVYVAGNFTKVNNVSTSHVALLDVNTGAPVAGFKAASTNGSVTTLTKAGSRLLLGGYFTTAGGVEHKGLASIAPTTGVIDNAYMGIDVSERHNNSGSGATGAIGVKDMEATPDGSKLVVIGNFRKADGLDRVQAMVVNLSGATATVDANWRTRRFEPLCYSWSFDATVRGVAVSPDGSYFAIASTGGGTRNTLCDTAARFEFSSAGQDIQPTWINSTGGDTLWSVEVTEKAVYVGGHQRWQNNSDGVDKPEQGSVPRPGLAALSTESGVPLEWNPGRLPRGEAAFSIYAAPAGLWVGSDTEYIGDFKYKRPRIAYFPLEGGAPEASNVVAKLPGDVLLASRTTLPVTANNLAAISFNGTTASGPTTRDNRGMAWDSVRGAFMLGDTLFYGKTDGYLYKRTFTQTVTGPEVKLDPYNDPEWAEAQTGSGGTLRGKVPTFYGQISGLTGLFYANGRIYFTRSGDSNLYWRGFNADSGIVGSYVNTANGGRTWTDTNGMFKDGNNLYIVSKATGRLQKMAFSNGAPSGAVTVVDSARDWRAKTVFIGPSAPAANVAPTATFTASCDKRVCTVNGAGSSDPDGSIASYSWTFGDGGTATGATPPAYTYGADGSYPITLTVTDNQGATGTSTQTVDVAAEPAPPSELSYVGQTQTSVQSLSPQAVVPADVQIGDRLVLIGSYGVATADPATPAGWTPVSSKTATGMTSHVWTKQATASDIGGSVTTSMSASTKTTLTLAAYRGVSATDPLAAVASSTDGATTQHTSPTVTAPGGGWVVQLWSDKSTATTSWTAPGGVSVRGTSYGTGAGHTAALLADSGGPVSAGTYGGQVATTDSSSARAIAWTIALSPRAAGSNPPPTAAFSKTCTELRCTVDGTASSDPGGSIASYAWTFGDGGTASGATPAAHTYAAAGSYPITLTVTDNEGATGTTTQTVEVAPAPPPASNLGFVGQNQASVQSLNPQLSVPAAVQAGDQLILIGSYAVAAPNPTTPAGWTLASTRVASAMESYVWTRTATGSDAGTTVSTQLGLSSAPKSTLTLAAYRGVAASGGIAGIASSTDGGSTQHTSPTVAAPAGGWVIQLWSDKSSGTTAWTAPAGTTTRGTSYGTGTGRSSALLTDSGGPVSAGTYGGQVATTDAASGRAIAWTIALAAG